MQPPLVTFKDTTDLKKTLRLEGQLPKSDEKRFDRLVASKLPPLLSPTVFGIILGISPKLITAMARHPRRNYPYYRTFHIPKKAGGKRIILAPRRFLKAIQKYILRQILEKRPLPPCVMGFVRKKGIVDNAALHTGCDYMLKVDIKDFFPSVTEGQVLGVFEGLGYTKPMSRILARLCTYNNALPQGAPTSPCLANLVFSEVDLRLMKLAEKQGLQYTRYADDLTFSGSRRIQGRLLEQVTGIVNKGGFQLNAKKTRFGKPGQPLYVTGFVVNVRVQLCREERRRIRAMFHNASKRPSEFRKQSAVLLGWASFVHSYDRPKGREYLKIAQKVAAKPAKSKSKK